MKLAVNAEYRDGFQFHEGPIKTIKSRGKPHPVTGFNSMKVRLKPAVGGQCHTLISVSIP